MNKTIKIILLLTLFITGKSASAQKIKSAGGPVFKGTICLSGNQKSQFDSVIIKYKPPFTPAAVEYTYIRLLTDKYGQFTFSLPRYGKPCKMLIYVRHKNRALMLSDGYFVEPFDNINMSIFKGDTRDSASFSGKGSEKYNIVQRITEIGQKFVDDRSKPFYIELNKKELTQKLLGYNSFMSKYVDEKQNLISTSQLSSFMKRLISLENDIIFWGWHAYMNAHYRIEKDSTAKQIIRAHYNKYRPEFWHQPDTLIKLCPISLEMEAAVKTIEMVINSPTPQLGIQTLYNTYKNDYQGYIREAIITNMLTTGRGLVKEITFNKNELDSLLKVSLNLVTNPVLHHALMIKLRQAKGAELYNASLQDINGNIVNTTSFIGKIVLLDFWGLGCSYCAIFHKEFYNRFYVKLKDNKNFMYVAVNVDNTTEKWKKGLESGLYTAKEYLNLNTGPLGIAHPLAQYYNVNSLPFALLIDKNGMIVSEVFDTAKAYAQIQQLLADSVPN